MSETTNSSYLYYGKVLPGFKLQLLKPNYLKSNKGINSHKLIMNLLKSGYT